MVKICLSIANRAGCLTVCNVYAWPWSESRLLTLVCRLPRLATGGEGGDGHAIGIRYALAGAMDDDAAFSPLLLTSRPVSGSALAAALALPDDGKVIACDVTDQWLNKYNSRQVWQDAGVAHKIDLRIAPALETLEVS